MKNINGFKRKKIIGHKISMVTCYDAWSARIINGTDIDCILVGDSLAVVMHGFDSTIHATLEMMELHTAAVARSAPDKFIISDMPFMSCSKGTERALDSVQVLMQAGASAVKVEGADHQLQTIKRIIEAGVPVIGHLGLTPQSIHNLGGHRVQGRNSKKREKILNQAKALEEVGCFAVVLECIPNNLGARISSAIDIPTIGIGAGPNTDGQVLVLQDLLGADPDFNPKFLRRYADIYQSVTSSLQAFHEDVTTSEFPSFGESYG